MELHPPYLSVLSMGWGRQTWTLAAMMALGEIPKADYVVHSDTGHEMAGTYAFRQRWEGWLTEHGLNVVTVLPTKNHVVVQGPTQTSVRIPAFTLNTETQSQGRVNRGCTAEWKIEPIRRFYRQRLAAMGLKAVPGAVRSIQGISLDEWQRMKDSDVAYITHSYPLVDLRMGLDSCLAWLERQGLPEPPKSSCTFCPFHSTAAWKRMKQEGGPDWNDAVSTDEAIRTQYSQKDKPVALYLHRSGKPLGEAVRIPEDQGEKQSTMFDHAENCDGGYCGV